MKTRSVSITFALVLSISGCGRRTSNQFVYLDLDDLGGAGGGEGGEGGNTETGESCNTTSTGGNEGSCVDPQLGYNSGLVPDGELQPTADTIGNIEAARLAPFDADTTCQTVIVGLSAAAPPCEVPAAIELAIFDSSEIMPSAVPSLFDVVPISEDMLYPTASLGMLEVRIPLATAHLAGLYPVVGARLRSNLCPLLMPWCDATRSVECAAGVWSEQDAGQLYFGLADCVTPVP